MIEWHDLLIGYTLMAVGTAVGFHRAYRWALQYIGLDSSELIKPGTFVVVGIIWPISWVLLAFMFLRGIFHKAK